MLDRGFRIAKLAEPEDSAAGISAVREWQWDTFTTSQAAMDAARECRERFAPYVAKSEAEIREIYDKWTDEWNCLVELGYRPTEPPSVEKFVADWQSGPWLPVDGLNMATWSDADFQKAKAACGIEMIDRE